MGELFICSFFFGMLLYLFPVFVCVDAFADLRENKCWFALSLFKYLRIFGGYLECRKEGIVFHLTKKKAVILPFKELAPMRKKFEITKGFQLYRFHQIVETGGEGSPLGVAFGAVFLMASGQICSVLHTLHPFLSLKNSVLLTERADFKLTVQGVTIFNGLVLTLAIGKKILEAIINWIRKKRSTAFWKKRRSSSPA